jgi:hypothetical protein
MVLLVQLGQYLQEALLVLLVLDYHLVLKDLSDLEDLIAHHFLEFQVDLQGLVIQVDRALLLLL